MTRRPVGVLGGGRWGRVVVSVLVELGQPIAWISKFGFKENSRWLKENGYTDVNLFEEEVHNLEGVSCLFVVTKTSAHETDVARLQGYNVPILVEKPFALNSSNAERMVRESVDRAVPVWVNLEFSHSSDIHQFKKKLKNIEISHFELCWFDPAKEHRHNEVKESDHSISIVDDYFPHCWSIMRELLQIDSPDFQTASYESNDVLVISGVKDLCEITLRFSRRANSRARLITVNHGEFILDFTNEPGRLKSDGNWIQLFCDNRRPLNSVFNQFLESLSNDSVWSDPLNIVNCLDSVSGASNIDNLLNSL